MRRAAAIALGVAALVWLGLACRRDDQTAGGRDVHLTTAPTAPCEVTGPAPASDVALARAACDSMRARFRVLLGRDAPPGRVELSARPGVVSSTTQSGWWWIRWPVMATLRRTLQAVGREDVQTDWGSTLPHEIGHVALAAFAFPRGEPGGPHRYGTPLPDWLDEAVAISMEPAQARSYRISLARAAGDSLPALDSLQWWRHPNLATDAERGDVVSSTSSLRGPFRCARGPVCDTAENASLFGPHWRESERVIVAVHADGRTTVDTTYLPPDYKEPRDPNKVFYPAAISVLTWVRERGGPPAIQALLERARADSRWRDHLAGLPGLPGTAGEVNTAWRAWLRERR